MDLAIPHTQSAFFVLNVWEEQLACGHDKRSAGWRGELLSVDSNTTLRFEDWPELVHLIANAFRTPHSELRTRQNL